MQKRVHSLGSKDIAGRGKTTKRRALENTHIDKLESKLVRVGLPSTIGAAMRIILRPDDEDAPFHVATECVSHVRPLV